MELPHPLNGIQADADALDEALRALNVTLPPETTNIATRFLVDSAVEICAELRRDIGEFCDGRDRCLHRSLCSAGDADCKPIALRHCPG